MYKLLILLNIFALSISEEASASGNLMQVALKNGNFKKLLKDVTDLGLVPKFIKLKTATVFAPTDEIFAKVS